MFKNVKKEIVTIPAQMSYLGQIRDFIEQVGKKYKYSDKLANSFKLVIDEACTNIIRHGYRDVKGGEITLKAIIRRQSLTIVVIDQGKSYDPRQANTPDLEKYINIGKKGGLGIMMMRKLMDDVQYNITSRGNELRLTKQREQIVRTGPFALWDNLSMRARYTSIASAVLTVILIFVFFTLYFRIDNNTTTEVIEIARAQALSLADNSSDNLQRGDKDLELFELALSVKDNYPNLINEVLIVDTDNKIRALSSPLKALEFTNYNLPTDYETIADTVKDLSIYKYTTENQEIIYDFTADIHASVLENSPVIGQAHIWVNNGFIVERANSTKLQVIFGILILLIISYVLIYFLITKIVQPFHSLADWVREVGAGTVDEDEIDIDSSDELGEIAQAFNHMTGKFREAQVNLMEQQRLQKELQVAQEIQHMT
jgi:serine/threonine-protein kinase RsbW